MPTATLQIRMLRELETGLRPSGQKTHPYCDINILTYDIFVTVFCELPHIRSTIYQLMSIDRGDDYGLGELLHCNAQSAGSGVP